MTSVSEAILPLAAPDVSASTSATLAEEPLSEPIVSLHPATLVANTMLIATRRTSEALANV